MTRIQSLALCLAWSLLLVSSAAAAVVDDAAAARVELNDLLRTEAFQGRSLKDLEAKAKRALSQHDEERLLETEFVFNLDEEKEEEVVTTEEPRTVPGYDSTPVPTSAPGPDDFANLNDLLRNTELALPDTDIQEMLLFQLLQIALRNMVCSELSFDDIKVTPDLRSQQAAGMDFAMVGLGLTCEFDFQWSYIFLVGNGHANVKITDSSATAGMDLYSPDFTMFPPDSAQVTKCATDINIEGIDFSGNIASEIFNLFEQLIVDVLNSLLNDLVCGQLQEAGSDAVGEALGMLDEFLGPLMERVEDWRYNISYPEATMVIPANSSVITWNDDSGFGDFMMAAMDEVDSYMGSLSEDENAPADLTFPNGTEYPEGFDLGINVMLRKYLLDADRAFTVNGTTLSGYNQTTDLVQMHDQLTETNISLVELKVWGLDTFTVMEPLQRVGNHTLQNSLSWEYLSFDVTIRMEMKASSLEDSIIRDSERVQPYVEEIHLTVGIEDVQTIISVMVALDLDLMSEIQLGSLIDLTSMIPCVLSSLQEFQMAGLNVSLGDIRLPTGEGLLSPGVDRLLKDGLELGFFMFKGTILQIIPSLFQSTIRDLITDFLDEASCPVFDLEEDDAFIDLRDLLLNEEDAKKAGADGEGPYGDLTSTIYGIAEGLWEEVEEDGSLGLNSLLIEPVTASMSGVEGRFQIDDILYNFTTNEENQKEFKELVDKFEFIVYNLRVDNLNTVVHPMAVIQPINHPYISQSTINMGPMENAPINATIRLLIALDIEDSPLAMDNIVDMGVSVSSIEVFVEALTMISQNNFLNFRLGDGFDVSCWFATISAPELNERGYRTEGTKDQGIEMRRFLAKMSDLELHFDCIQCSPGLASASSMVDIYERSKVTSIVSYRIPLFLEEIAISEVMQVAFDRWLVDAPRACPHRLEYDEEWKRPETWESPKFTQLSVEASDTIFFTVLAASELAFVLVVETHAPWELSTLEPLSGQENFIEPEGSKVFNWMNLSETFDNMANDARDYLSQPRADKETKVEELGVNLVVRDFGSDDGEIDFVELVGDEPLTFDIEGVEFFFHHIKVRGLDSFTRFDIMKPIAPQTILNSMHLRYLEIDVVVSTGSRTSPDQLVELSFSMKDINATVPLFAAIDQRVLESLELGHFLMGDSFFSCFLTSAVDIHFPQILLTLGELSTPTFKGFLPDSGEALRQSVGEVFERYGERALKALPIMFDVTGRTFINTYISDFINDRANCTHIEDVIAENTPVGEELYPYTDYIDFRELLLRVDNATALGGRGNTTYGDMMRSLVAPIQNELLWVDPETGMAALNDLIGPMSEFLSGEEGTLIVPGEYLPEIPKFDMNVGTIISNITFGMQEIRVENMDTIGDPLSLMMPVFMRPYYLKNSAGVGMGGDPISVSLRFTTEIEKWDDDGEEIEKITTNEMIVKLSINDATAVFDLLAMISEDKFIHYSMADVFDPYCWLSLIPAPKLNRFGIKEDDEVSYLSFTALEMAVSKMNLTMECVECGSVAAHALVAAFAEDGASEALTDIANDALNMISSLVTGNLVQDYIDRAFDKAQRYCPSHPNYVEDPDLLKDLLSYDALDFSTSVPVNNVVFLVTGVLFSLIIAFAVITTVVRCIVNRRHQKWIRTLPVQKVHIIQHLQDADTQLENELNANTSSMITTKEVPAWIRWSMPVVIVLNIGMFLSGHLSIAADVAMTIVIAGEDLPMGQFFSFSIIKATVDMWDAGAEEMAVFILTFSGIWPYVKQILSLICWVIPPTWLSITTRGKTYLWLDTLAKWSMVDIFVILLYMIAFRVKAGNPDVAFLPDDFFKFEFYIIPRWGIYANLIAQLISQISSHFIIHYHRSIVTEATRAYEARHASMRKTSVATAEDSDDPSEGSETECGRLCDGAFARPHKGESSKLIARQIASYGLVVGTFLLVLFLIIGCSLPFMSVEIQGVMSYIAGDFQYKEFNIFDLAELIFNDSLQLGGVGNVLGHLLLAGTMILTVFITPIVQSIALAFHWFRPMNDKQRRKFAIFIEIVAAWQYAEVFILAVVVSAWQQGTNSELVMQEQCSNVNHILKMAAYYGVFGKEKAHCFRVESTILAGSYFLLAATVLLAILNSFVMKASFQHFWDNECIRKEDAMDEHLTFEEAATPIDDKTYKKIRPPPVLFTDSFRWLLRAEHLGDRPLKNDEPLKGLLVEGHGDALDHDDKLSSASSETWQPKSIEEPLVAKTPQSSVTKSPASSVTRSQGVIDVDELLLTKTDTSTDIYC